MSARAHWMLLVSACLGLGACAELDPLTTTNRWNPTGANDANLLVQVAHPDDLVSGRGTTDADGQIAEAAVTRLRHDHVKPLPDSGVTTLQIGNQTAPAAGASGGAP